MATTSDLILMADRLLDRTDLFHLNCSCLLPTPPCTDQLALLTLEEGASFDKIFCFANGTAILGALYNLGITVGCILKVTGDTVTYSLALRFDSNASSLVDSIYELLKLQFPHAKKQDFSILPLFNSSPYAIASTTFLPTSKYNTPTILPTLFNLFKPKDYTLFFLLEPLDVCTYLQHKKKLLSLYTQLFSLRETTHSCTDSNSSNNTKGSSSSESLTLTHTDSNNDSTVKSSSTSEVSSGNFNFSPKLCERATVAQSGSSSCTTNNSSSNTNATSHVCTEQKVCSSSLSDSDACNTSKSHTYGSKDFNREIDLHLKKIDDLIALFEINQTLPLFQFAMYVIGHTVGDALLIQNTYNTLLQPTTPSTKSFYVNYWDTPPHCTENILYALETLHHPLFKPPNTPKPISPTLTSTSYELNQLLFNCPPPSSTTIATKATST